MIVKILFFLRISSCIFLTALLPAFVYPTTLLTTEARIFLTAFLPAFVYHTPLLTPKPISSSRLSISLLFPLQHSPLPNSIFSSRHFFLPYSRSEVPITLFTSFVKWDKEFKSRLDFQNSRLDFSKPNLDFSKSTLDFYTPCPDFHNYLLLDLFLFLIKNICKYAYTIFSSSNIIRPFLFISFLNCIFSLLRAVILFIYFVIK